MLATVEELQCVTVRRRRSESETGQPGCQNRPSIPFERRGQRSDRGVVGVERDERDRQRGTQHLRSRVPGGGSPVKRETPPVGRPRPRPPPHRARERCERFDDDSPAWACHVPATKPSTRNVCATSPFFPVTFLRYGSGSTRVRSWNASSTLSHFGRKRAGAHVSGSGWSPRNVEELLPLLVAEAPVAPADRRTLDLGHVHHRPRDPGRREAGPKAR